MTLQSFFLLFIAAGLMAIANLLMKGGIQHTGHPLLLSFSGILSVLLQPLYLSGIALVGVAGILWCRILSTDRLTVSYPLFVSLTCVLIAIGAMFFFGEKLTFHKVTGMGFVLLGIVMLTRP